MCEIFLLYKTSGTINKSLINKLSDGMYDSSEVNNDGFGAFNDKGVMYRSRKKFKKKDKSNLYRFIGSKFIIAHTRNSTSGNVSVKNSHPFVYKNIYFVHNGIVDGSVINDKSKECDSLQLLKLIAGDKKDIINGIKSALRKVWGSVSCFLYYKGILYYFRKNSRFNIEYMEKENLIVGSTISGRMENITRIRKKEFFYGSSGVSGWFAEGDIYKIECSKISKIDDFEMGDKPKQEIGYLPLDSVWYKDKNSLSIPKKDVCVKPNYQIRTTTQRKRLHGWCSRHEVWCKRVTIMGIYHCDDEGCPRLGEIYGKYGKKKESHVKQNRPIAKYKTAPEYGIFFCEECLYTGNEYLEGIDGEYKCPYCDCIMEFYAENSYKS